MILQDCRHAREAQLGAPVAATLQRAVGEAGALRGEGARGEAAARRATNDGEPRRIGAGGGGFIV